jgi:hypothetical protein
MPLQEKRLLSHNLDLTQYLRFPVYSFDFGFLLGHVPTIANWSREKLEAVIGGRADNIRRLERRTRALLPRLPSPRMIPPR